MLLRKLTAGFLAVLCALAVCAQTGAPATFTKVATYQALGGLVATTVAPGPAPGSERLYASYLYADNTLDVIAVDPATGQSEVFHNVVPGEYGARNIAVGPDGDVYLGTLPHAHFIRIDRKAHRMIDLGQPSPGEEYIWDVAFGSDRRLYGVTYPGCKLVRYDPRTAKLEDLGRMDPTEKYGRWIVGGHDRYMYIGIGTAKANLAVYDTQTGVLREVLPEKYQKVGIAKPYTGVDGKTYATLDDHRFALNGFSIRELSPQDNVAAETHDVLRDGTILSLTEDDGFLVRRSPHDGTESKLPISYRGEELQIFRLGFGPDGNLYGSSILPIHFFRVDVAEGKIAPVGDLGGGEIYSFLAHGPSLLMGAYSGVAPLMAYRPGEGFDPKPDGNPKLVEFPHFDHAWRPQAMIAGPDGRVYVGATAGYGQLEGPLVSWTGEPGSVEQFEHIVPAQSIVSLAATDRLIAGGTTTLGGGGSHPTATAAHVFMWDPATKKVVHDTALPGEDTITDLIISRSGILFGVAVHGAEHTLFAMDPSTGAVRSRSMTSFHDVVYNGVGLLTDGTIIGLASTGVFAIDEAKGEAHLIAQSPEPVTGGFALRGNTLFFVSGSHVYSVPLQVSHAR